MLKQTGISYIMRQLDYKTASLPRHGTKGCGGSVTAVVPTTQVTQHSLMYLERATLIYNR